MNRTSSSSYVAALTLCLFGCGGGGGGSSAQQEPLNSIAAEASSQTLTVMEDSQRRGILSVAAPPEEPITYAINSGPAHGSVTLDPVSGQFTYTPVVDFFGVDSFDFTASGSASSLTQSTVTIQIDNVNDPPEIDDIPDLTNSAYAETVTVPISVRDVDGDPVTITTAVTNAAIADATVDVASRSLTLRPKGRGQTTVQVIVRDATTVVSTSFYFTVQDVTRAIKIDSSVPAEEAIVLANQGNSAVAFSLTHNGHLAFASMAEVLATIRSLPDEVLAEPLERKIWRFVRDNVYHAPSLSEDGWLIATWPTLNSLGWGLCANASGVFVQIAQAAGFSARIWELTGHVTAEIQVNGSWQMYDPDISVYYYDVDGTIASVDDLQTNPNLISAPITPIFQPGQNSTAYSTSVAGIYATSSDNRVAPYLSTEPFRGSGITLPPGARLMYPGRWTVSPIGYVGTVPQPVEQFRQARIELPENYSGFFTVPWMLWDIQGTGRVRISGLEFQVGSAALRNYLSLPGRSLNETEVIDSQGGLSLILMINPLWYDMNEDNHLELTGKDVWAITSGTYPLAPENRPPPPVPEALRKPRA